MADLSMRSFGAAGRHSLPVELTADAKWGLLGEGEVEFAVAVVGVFAGLDVFAGLEGEGGEVSAVDATGIDAGVSIFDSGEGLVLWSVAADEELSVFPWLEAPKALPVELVDVTIFGVLVEREGGVGEKKAVYDMERLEGGEELPVCVRNIGELARLVGSKGFDAAVEEPKGRRGRAEAGLFHHDFVVAPQGDEVDFFFELDEAIDHSFGRWAAVGVVAEGHDDIVLSRRNKLHQGVERAEAAVNISKDKCHVPSRRVTGREGTNSRKLSSFFR